MRGSCDGKWERADGEGCKERVTFVCSCRRCSSEDEGEKFYACAEHVAEAGKRHERIRERTATWIDLQPSMGPFDVVVLRREAEVESSRRRRLPDERASVTHRFRVGDMKAYLTVGLYPDGRPGEVFIVVDHRPEGEEDHSVSVRGFVDAVAVQTSLLLQHGVPLEVAVGKLLGMNFVPRGFTGNPEIPRASSILDYAARWLLRRYAPVVYAARFGVQP